MKPAAKEYQGSSTHGMMRMSKMRILFVGNSHTYNHEVPALVQEMAKEAGLACDVTMLAHGNWFLANHVKEAQTKFNILHGAYDYVVLQEHSRFLKHMADYEAAVKTIAEWAAEVGSRVVIYGTWSRKEERDVQDSMNEANREIASSVNALLAPVGESWWTYVDSYPDIEMYEEDGAHASALGAEFAAKIIWSVIEENLA